MRWIAQQKKPGNDCQVIFTKTQADPAFLFEKQFLLSLAIDDEENLLLRKPVKKG